MAEQIRIPVSADTTRLESDIANAGNRARVIIRPTLDSRGLESISRPLGKITGQADEFTKSMEAANARVLAFGASVGVLNAVAKSFQNIVSSSIQVEKTLTEISVASGQAASGMEALGKGIFNVARNTGTSFKEAADAALEFSRQGASMEESLKRAQAALVLTRTTGLDAAESVKGLTAAVKTFNDAGLDYEAVVNKLANVDTKFAVSSRDLIEGISRSASVAQEAGVSFDELTALITTLQEKTARGGAVIGNALKTIFTRVQSTENLDLLKSLGIAVNDVSGDILPATVIIKKLANELNNLDSSTRKSVLIKIGGGFQIDKLAAVLNDLADANGTFQKSLNASQNAGNEAFAKVDKLAKTTDAAFERLKISGIEFASTIGKIAISDDLKNLFEKGSSFFESLTENISGGETIGSNLGKAIIKGIGGVISGPTALLGIALAGKLLIGFADFLNKSLQSQLGLNSKKKEQESLERAIFEALTKNSQVQQNILSLEGNKVQQAEYLLQVYSQQADFLQKMSVLSKEIAPTLLQAGIRTSEQGVKKIPSAAGGFMPITDAIKTERKMAPAGAKIKIDNNFPMGGGKFGTMVYNDKETLIPNFAGSGGTAIIPNYKPRNAAKGYVPNFAQQMELTSINKPSLFLNAEDFGVAGLTIGGKENVKKVRSKMVQPSLFSKFEIDEKIKSIISNYSMIELDNVNVGNVYRRDNENLETINANEDQIKDLFKERANNALSPQIGNFIKNELDFLKIKPTAAMSLALKNGEKFKFIDDSIAGSFFEMILKAANMGFADKNWASFIGKSEQNNFDLYGLKSELAAQYGLPEKNWPYVEVKSSTQDLSGKLLGKFLNELKSDGPLKRNFISKYGGARSSAKGYIPNFAKTYIKKYSEGETGTPLKNLYDTNVSLKNLDYFTEALKIKDDISLSSKKTLQDYTQEAEDIFSQIQIDPENSEKILLRKGIKKFLSNNFDVSKIKKTTSKASKIGSISNIKGALAERDFSKIKPKFEKKENEYGVDFANGYDLYEVKARQRSLSQQEAYGKVLRYIALTEKNSPWFKDQNADDLTDLLNKYTLHRVEVENAANGYIPNFAKTQNVSGFFSRWTPKYAEMSEEDVKKSFSTESKGTSLKGTTLSESDPYSFIGIGKKSLLENNIIASILGNNAFFSPFQNNISEMQSKIQRSDIERFAERISSGGQTVSIGDMGFGEVKKYITRPNEVVSGKISGEFKNLKYETLKDIFPRLWQMKGLGPVWEKVKQLASFRANNDYYYLSNDPEEKAVHERLKENTKILRDAALEAVLKYNPNLSGFNIDLSGTEEENFAKSVSDRTDVSYLSLFTGSGISDFENVGKIKSLKDKEAQNRKLESIKNAYRSNGISYRDFKNNEQKLRSLGKWGNYDSAKKRIYLTSADGYIPNFVSEKGLEAMKKIASGSTPEAQAFRDKLNSMLSFETVQRKYGGFSYVGKMGGKNIASLDFIDQGSELSLDDIKGSDENLIALLQNFRKKFKGRKISYPIFGANQKAVNILNLKKGTGYDDADYIGIANKGFIPNFAQGPLMDAIQREKLESGLPLSAISVVKDKKLIGEQNPMGLAVINRRDEPNGKIPNFANKEEISQDIVKAFEEAVKSLSSVSGDLSEAVKQTAENGKSFGFTVENLNKGIDLFLENKPISQALTGQNNSPQQETNQTNQVRSSQEIVDANKKQAKSVQESTFNILKWQAALSFTEGALSSFGESAALIGKSINNIGQALYSVQEGKDLISQFAFGGKEKFSETAAGRAFSLARRGTALGGQPTGGAIGGLVRGGFAALGAEGGLAAVGGALATGGLYLGAAVLAVKGLDSALQAFNGSSEKTTQILNLTEEAQTKYGISLSNSQKRLLDIISEAGNVSGTGISGFFNKTFGSFFSGEQQNQLVQQLGDTGLQNAGNQALVNLIGTANLPQIEERLKQQQFEKFQKEGRNIRLEDIKVNPQQIIDELKTKQVEILKTAQNAALKTQRENAQKQLEEFDKVNAGKPFYEEGKGEIAPRTELGFQRKVLEDLIQSNKVQDTSALFQEVVKLLQNSNVEAKNLTAQTKEIADSFLYSTQYLQKQFEVYQQIEKINASRMTDEEAGLEISKQLLSTSEKQKQIDEFKLKTLQQEKNTRAEIKDVVLSAGRSQISTFIQNRGNQITEDQATKISENFKNNLLNAGDSIEEIQSAFNKFVIELNNAGTNKDFIENLQFQGKIVVENVKAIKAQNEATKYQNALDLQNRSIIEQQNYQYSIQKEFLQAKINAAQKELDIRKELRSIENTKQTLNLEKSLFNVPERLASRQRTQLEIAQQYKDKNAELSERQQSILLQNRSQLFSFLEKRGVKDLGEFKKASEATSPEQFREIAKKALTIESNDFQTRVTTAADEFYKIVTNAGDDVAVSLGFKNKEDLVSQRLLDLKSPLPNDINQLEDLKLRVEAIFVEKIKNQKENVDTKDFDKQLMRLNEKIEQINKLKSDSIDFSGENLDVMLGLNQGVPNIEQQRKNIANEQALKAAQENLKQYKEDTFRGGMLQTSEKLQEEIDTFGNQLGKDIPFAFRDGMVQAMKDISSGTKSVKNGLLDAAAAFLQKINDALMQNAANQIVKPFTNFIGNSGAPSAPAFASGGLISGGSGTKDDVPSMLMGGEFVVNKKIVQMYGKDFFEKLNSGKLKKFASGGFVPTGELDPLDFARNPQKYSPYGQKQVGQYSFDEQGNIIGDLLYKGSEENKQDSLKKAQTDFYSKNAQQLGPEGFLMPGKGGAGAIIGQKNLLTFATQERITPKFDVIKGSGSSASIDIAGGSSNLSLFAMRNMEDSRTSEFAQAKEKAFDLYLQGVGANKETIAKREEVRKAEEERKKQEKEARKKMWRGVATQFAISAAMNIAGGLAQNWASSGQQAALDQKISNINMNENMPMNAGMQGATMGYDRFGNPYSMSNPATLTNTSLTGWESIKSGVSGIGSGLNPFSKSLPSKNLINVGDSIYSWQNGGYNMVQKPTTRQYQSAIRRAVGGYVPGNGTGDNVPAMLNGGEFVISRQAAEKVGYNKLAKINSGSEGSSSEELISRLEQKLEELINNISGTGTINISVNSNAKGSSSEDESQSGDTKERDRELAKRIKETVLFILKEEKRIGGLLR